MVLFILIKKKYFCKRLSKTKKNETTSIIDTLSFFM